MRTVFQFPARITSWAEAPRAVSSLANPTRPEWAVSRGSTPAARAAAENRSLTACAERPTTRSVGAMSPRRSRSDELEPPRVPAFGTSVATAAQDAAAVESALGLDRPTRRPCRPPGPWTARKAEFLRAAGALPPSRSETVEPLQPSAILAPVRS